MFYATRVDSSREPPHVLPPAAPEKAPGRGLGRAGPVALIATVLPVIGSLSVLALGPFIAGWLRGQGWFGVVLFTAVFALLGAVALAPTYTTSVIAGWTFGFSRGFPAVTIGLVSGATMCYLAARKLAGDRVQGLFEAHPRWEVVRRALLEDRPFKTLWIVFLMRLSPVLPFRNDQRPAGDDGRAAEHLHFRDRAGADAANGAGRDGGGGGGKARL